jgi:hypothetical protein
MSFPVKCSSGDSSLNVKYHLNESSFWWFWAALQLQHILCKSKHKSWASPHLLTISKNVIFKIFRQELETTDEGWNLLCRTADQWSRHSEIPCLKSPQISNLLFLTTIMKAELQVQTQKEHFLQATAESRKQLHKIKCENPRTAMNNLQKELHSTFWLLIAHLSSTFARKTDWELLSKNGKIITLHL